MKKFVDVAPGVGCCLCASLLSAGGSGALCCVANKGMFAPENVFWVNSEEKKREKKRERERDMV